MSLFPQEKKDLLQSNLVLGAVGKQTNFLDFLSENYSIPVMISQRLKPNNKQTNQVKMKPNKFHYLYSEEEAIFYNNFHLQRGLYT